jgi:hypothetical protein
MENHTLIKQLDFVFFVLKDRPEWIEQDKFNPYLITHNVVINQNKILVLLDYLADEKLVDKLQIQPGFFKYRITVKGLLFNGFENQDNSANEEHARLELLEDQQVAQAKALNKLTRLLARGMMVASIFAFLLLLWETRHAMLALLHQG